MTAFLPRLFRSNRPPAITPAQLDAALKSLALSDHDFSDLALELGVTAPILRQWASGATPFSNKKAKWIAFQLYAFQRIALFESSGLPECEWMQALHKNMPAHGSKNYAREIRAHLKALRAHWADCKVCLARRQFVKDHLGPIPLTFFPWWQRFFVWRTVRRVDFG